MMNTPMKLLIAYDGSACGAQAIDDLQRAGLPARDVEAIVMTIADVWPGMPGTDYPKLYPEAAKRVRLRVAEALQEARNFAADGLARVNKLFPGWRAETEVVADSPYWGLIKKAQEWRADLIVVGSHGRSAAGRLLFGSVSQNAVLYADCSVRVGRCRVGGPVAADAPVRFIMGWDGSENAAIAIRAAGARSWPPGSVGRIVTALDLPLATTALPDDPQGPPITATVDDVRDALLFFARRAADELRAKGLQIEDPVIRAGEPKRVLIEEAESWGVDCIFVGAKGLSRIERVLLGSVSASVAARATCSVEVVRAQRTT